MLLSFYQIGSGIADVVCEACSVKATPQATLVVICLESAPDAFSVCGAGLWRAGDCT